MAVCIFRFTDHDENRATSCGTIPQGVGERRIHHDAVLRLCTSLPVEREHERTCQAGAEIDAAIRLYEHFERNRQTVRRNNEFLGQGRESKTGDTAAIGIFLRQFHTSVTVEPANRDFIFKDFKVFKVIKDFNNLILTSAVRTNSTAFCLTSVAAPTEQFSIKLYIIDFFDYLCSLK